MSVNSTNDLRFCPASPTDAPVIFAMAKELIDTYEDCTAIDYDKVIDWVQRKITNSIESYTCVYLGSDKVGFFCLTEESGQCELDDLYVLPQFRGQGIGTAIVCRCITQTNKPLYLYVFKGNAGAVKLYTRMGFSVAENVSTSRFIMRRNVDRQ